jgi:hypothetical protein
MELPVGHIMKRLEVTNTSNHLKGLILEPWASEYPIAPGETLIVEAEGPADYAVLEVDEDDQDFTVYAWDGSDARILRADGTVLDDWTGIRVPDWHKLRDAETTGDAAS